MNTSEGKIRSKLHEHGTPTEFGTTYMPKICLSKFRNSWSNLEIANTSEISLHPGSHALHYGSTCFEGLKAFRHQDGTINIFRMHDNIQRLRQSSDLLCMPPIDTELTSRMIRHIVGIFRDDVPLPPSSMYIRPTHIGTDSSIGKASEPTKTSLLYVLLSPGGNYFHDGEAALRVMLTEEFSRCAPDHGMVKSGGNYSSALKHLRNAKMSCRADQVLFCPDGEIGETGVANFIFIDGGSLITRALDKSILHGITRDSVLTLARAKGLKIEERELSIEELLQRCTQKGAEAALTGTAAVMAAVTTFVYHGDVFQIGNGRPGQIIRSLREDLNAIQWGEASDPYSWLTRI